MSEQPEPGPGLLGELKRRKVVRAALVYGAAVFAVLQVADVVVEPLGLPTWFMSALVWLALLGFPVTVVVAWFVDLSEDRGSARRWMSLEAAAAVVLLVTVGVVGWTLRPRALTEGAPASRAIEPGAVVVLPFTALGSEDSGYLSEAVPKLLSTSLDGLAGLRIVSSHALLGYPGLKDVDRVSETLAGEVADHFGAGLWVVGDVMQAGDSIRIEATLASRTGASGDRVSAEVTSGLDDLFASVDQLAALLVAEREAGVGSARTRTAASTTSSIPALRAYIEGERAFRAGSYLVAVDAFSRAVRADTAFALAFYRLSMTQERLAWAEASRRSAEAALRHAHRLSPREQEFLEAVVALRRGNTSDAEQRLRSYVRVHPEDPEAWYQLGEILFHGEPLRGGSMTAAREPLEIALTYDPGDLGALYHLVRIAVKDGDRARLDSLTARFVDLSPTGERTLELRALQAVSESDTASFAEILGEMRGSPDPFLPIAVWSVATFGGSPGHGESVARLMTGPDRPSEVRGAGYVQLAHLALAQGRYRDARRALEQASGLGDPDADEAAVWLAVLPFVEASEADLDAAEATLARRRLAPPLESPRPSSFFSAQNGVHDVVDRYLAGIIAARRGDREGVRGAVATLETAEGVEGAQGLARQLAVGVRAQDALAAGDSVGALEALSSLEVEGWYELTFVSPYFSGAMERFVLAELLFAAGREDEALPWYQGLGENTVAELVFSGPALLREAEIHRRAGRIREVERLRRRFDALWSRADQDLRRRVTETYGP